jgi:hypothetical protein
MLFLEVLFIIISCCLTLYLRLCRPDTGHSAQTSFVVTTTTVEKAKWKYKSVTDKHKYRLKSVLSHSNYVLYGWRTHTSLINTNTNTNNKPSYSHEHTHIHTCTLITSYDKTKLYTRGQQILISSDQILSDISLNTYNICIWCGRKFYPFLWIICCAAYRFLLLF